SVVFEGAFLQTLKKSFAIRAGKMKNFFNVNHVTHDFRLVYVSRNSVEDQNVDVGFKFVRVDCGIDCFFPKLDRDVVGNEVSFARIFEKCFTDSRPRVDRTKYVAAGAMVEPWNGAERFTLSAFAAARRAK